MNCQFFLLLTEISVSGTELHFENVMIICATVIYFGEDPVGYELVKENGAYKLIPASNHLGDFAPPVIRLLPATEGWSVSGTTDPDVQTQARKLVELQSLVDLPGTLSAAS